MKYMILRQRSPRGLLITLEKVGSGGGGGGNEMNGISRLLFLPLCDFK